jgi:hypothetical protein
MKTKTNTINKGMKTMIVHQLIIIVFSQSNAAAKHTLVTMIVVGYLNNLQRNP